MREGISYYISFSLEDGRCPSIIQANKLKKATINSLIMR